MAGKPAAAGVHVGTVAIASAVGCAIDLGRIAALSAASARGRLRLDGGALA